MVSIKSIIKSSIKSITKEDIITAAALAIIMGWLFVLYYSIRVLLRGFMASHGVDIPVLVYEGAIVVLWLTGAYIVYKKIVLPERENHPQ